MRKKVALPVESNLFFCEEKHVFWKDTQAFLKIALSLLYSFFFKFFKFVFSFENKIKEKKYTTASASIDIINRYAIHFWYHIGYIICVKVIYDIINK